MRLTGDASIRIAAGTIALLGLIEMLAWHFGIVRLVQLRPAYTPMQYNTALCFLLSGLAAMRVRSATARSMSLVVFAIGLVSVLEYVLGRPFGIDELLMRDYLAASTPDAGRMAPQTAIGFVLAGSALFALTLYRASTRANVIVNILSSLLGGLGIAAVVGYCIGLEPAYGWAAFKRIAPHTACGFIVLAFAMLQLAWRRHSTEQSRGPALLAIPVGVGALAVTASLFEALLVWQVDRIDVATTRNVERAAAGLEERLRGYVESFDALADQWGDGRGAGTSPEADVARFLRDQQVFLAVSRGGPDGKLSWVFPAAQYSDHVGLDFAADPTRRAWLTIARERRRAVLTEPLDLKSGKPGILLVAPLPAAPGEAEPFMAAAALLEDLFRPTASSMSAYRLAIFDGDNLLFGSKTENGNRAMSADPIRIDGASLRLEATPLPATIEAISSPLPAVVLVSGLFASVLLSMTAYLAQVSSRRAVALSAANASLAAAKEKLERLALFDELTGLGNRNLLLMEFDKRLDVAQRESLPLPLLLMDLNGFKAVNDTFGHEAGDDVLREFAARLRDSLPPSSEAFRTGGDEFAVLTRPGTSVDEALVVAREVERAMQAPLLVGGEQRAIGVSIGIASYPRHGGERTRVFRSADAAMYQAKHFFTGIQIASDEPPTAVLRALKKAQPSA